MNILKVENLKKEYSGRFNLNVVKVLKGVNFTVEQGEYVAIMGESGSGKTTLLNILASIDAPTSGTVSLAGSDMGKGREGDRAEFRRNNLGFVFQDFNLLDSMSNKDNIFLPLVLSEYKYGEMKRRLEEIKDVLGISDILNKYPYEISGGQKQRVAVARAVITKPKILLADEPTGALDSKASTNLLDLFENINKRGQTVIMVTHSALAASKAGRVLFIKDGIIFHEMYKGDLTTEKFHESILTTQSMILAAGDRLD